MNLEGVRTSFRYTGPPVRPLAETSCPQDKTTTAENRESCLKSPNRVYTDPIWARHLAAAVPIFSAEAPHAPLHASSELDLILCDLPTTRRGVLNLNTHVRWLMNRYDEKLAR